jgi:hypothetical protein
MLGTAVVATIGAVPVVVTMAVLVVVAVAGVPVPQTFMELKVSDQPSTIRPWSPLASSTMYRDHVPLASVPSNTDRAEPPEGAGAGAGKVSPVK